MGASNLGSDSLVHICNKHCNFSETFQDICQNHKVFFIGPTKITASSAWRDVWTVDPWPPKEKKITIFRGDAK
jgi:hypothetical protein